MNCPNCNTKLNNEKAPYCMRCGYLKSREITKNVNTNGVELKKRMHYIFNKYFLPTACLLILLYLAYSAYMMEKNKHNSIKPVNELAILNKEVNKINKLYNPDERLYNLLLNKNEKIYYRNILGAIIAYKENAIVDLSALNLNSTFKKSSIIEKVLMSLRLDHPELLHIKNFEYSPDDDVIYVSIKYTFEKADLNKRIDIIRSDLEEIKTATQNKSDYDKALYVYEWIALKNNKLGDSNTPYATFDVYLQPNSESIAKATQIILQYIGVDSIIVSYKKDGEFMYRNMVRLDDMFYNFDASRHISNEKPMQNNISYSGFLYNDIFSSVEYRKSVPYAYGFKYKFKND